MEVFTNGVVTLDFHNFLNINLLAFYFYKSLDETGKGYLVFVLVPIVER